MNDFLKIVISALILLLIMVSCINNVNDSNNHNILLEGYERFQTYKKNLKLNLDMIIISMYHVI